MVKFDPDRKVGYESAKLWRQRCASGFWERFITGPNVIDIGYRGHVPDAQPICDGALGLELGQAGYDGFFLPVPDEWADAVVASHLLEHVEPVVDYLREWFRALKPYGHLLLFVPSAYLYERRLTVPPSRFSGEHLAAYTPGKLLTTIEAALLPNSYRIRHLADEDAGYDYSLPKEQHPVGALEISLVLQKIPMPAWTVDP